MPETIPAAHVTHAIANRTRLRIPSRRGDRVFFASLATTLSIMPGIQRVTVQPVTGSVLLEHTKRLPKLLQAAQEAQLFKISESWQQPEPSQSTELDPKLLIGIGMGVFALWQLTQGRILPPAMTLGWYAASAAGLLSNHDASEAGE
jgi:hypothetical protein